MIIFENRTCYGWEEAIRGMRNPMNSWDKSDTVWCSINAPKPDNPVVANDKYLESKLCVGYADAYLMEKLAMAGTDHRKFMRMIVVYVDITAPLYWWKEFDTYKVGTVANSCSTMHKITAKEFTLDDFSHEHLYGKALDLLNTTIETLNCFRNMYLDADKGTLYEFEIHDGMVDKKDIWWQMIQLLPSSYNQKRTVMLNYEVLANIYKSRRNHKLDEWRKMREWIEELPYSKIIKLASGIHHEPTPDVLATEAMKNLVNSINEQAEVSLKEALNRVYGYGAHFTNRKE